jgi:hypothetical protein
MPSRDSTVVHRSPQQDQALPAKVLDALAQAVANLRFGQVQLTVHDGKVVQLDVTERHRF